MRVVAYAAKGAAVAIAVGAITLTAGPASARSFWHGVEHSFHRFEHHEERLAHRYARNWERQTLRPLVREYTPWLNPYRHR